MGATIWQLGLGKTKFKLLDENGKSYTITGVRKKGGCSSCNWKSFAIARVDNYGKIVYAVSWEKLRTVIDLFMASKLLSLSNL